MKKTFKVKFCLLKRKRKSLIHQNEQGRMLRFREVFMLVDMVWEIDQKLTNNAKLVTLSSKNWETKKRLRREQK